MSNSNILINKLIIILIQYRKFMQIKDMYIFVNIHNIHQFILN